MPKSLLATLHDMARGLHKAGAMDAKTLCEFDALSLPPIKHYTAGQVKRLRLEYKASQAAFAAYLNTSPSTVQMWERGRAKPSGASLKLLNLVEQKGLDALA